MRLRCVWMVLFVFAASCSGTKVVESWKRPDYEAPRFEKIVVIGLARTRAERNAFEKHVVAELAKRNYRAERGGTFLPLKPLDTDQDELREMVVSRGFDGAVVVALLSRRISVRAGAGVGAVDQSFGSLYMNYPINFGGALGASQTQEKIKYRLVARMYDLSQTGVMWRAETKTVDPKNRDRFAADFARKVVGRMAADGVLLR